MKYVFQIIFTIIFCGFLFSVVSCGKKNKKKKNNEKEYYTLKKNSHKGKKNKKLEDIKKAKNRSIHIPDISNKKLINKPEKHIILTDLFRDLESKKSVKKIPSQASKVLTEKEFADILIKETSKITDQEFELIRKSIFKSSNIDLGLLASYLSLSDNKRIALLTYDLITFCSINRIKYFKPNKFFVILAKLNYNAEPYLNKIITETNYDFCREWACELYVEIFYHNADNTDSRLLKLKKNKKMVDEIYSHLNELFSNPEKVKLILKSESPGRQIREVFGEDKRYPLKMLQIIRLLDNLNSKNLFASSRRISKIISSYKYNYSILNFLDGKVIPLPQIPEKVLLKYLCNAVFSDKIKDTYNWIPKENGGFSIKEAAEAFNSGDSIYIQKQNLILKKIITSVLRGKLLLGLGNRELSILRYFYYAVWNKSPLKWSNSMIIINNNTGKSMQLVLSQKINPKDMLTGNIISGKNNTEDRDEEFLVPAQSSFVWFADDAKFSLAPNKNNLIDDLPAFSHFEKTDFTLDSSIIININ
jgi:hypothetical protein